MKMKRREFVTSVIAGGLAVPAVASREQGHGHDRVDGPFRPRTSVSGPGRPAARRRSTGSRHRTRPTPECPSDHPVRRDDQVGRDHQFHDLGLSCSRHLRAGNEAGRYRRHDRGADSRRAAGLPSRDRRSERTRVSGNQSHHASAGSRRGGTIQPPRDVSRHLRFPAALRR